MKIQCVSDEEFLEAMYFLWESQHALNRAGLTVGPANRGAMWVIVDHSEEDEAFLEELKNMK